MAPIQKEKTRDVGAMLIQASLSFASIALLASVGWLISRVMDQEKRDFEQDQRINKEQYRNDTDDGRQQTNDKTYERLDLKDKDQDREINHLRDDIHKNLKAK